MGQISFYGIQDSESYVVNVTKKVTLEELDHFYKKWENKYPNFKDFRPFKIDDKENPELDINMRTETYIRDEIRGPFIHQGCENGQAISWGSYVPDECRYNKEVSRFTNELLQLFGDNTEASWMFTVAESYGSSEDTYVTVSANPECEFPKVEHGWDWNEGGEDDDEDEDDE
ncbi:MAG: hypothetical protein P9L95_03685 [Candidatus Tenebribacter mawsonii]|nr:hypothetical protein [Candidatus Tenebribacter mawsonii]